MIKPLMGVQSLWTVQGRKTDGAKHLTEHVKKSILEEPIVIPANLRNRGITIRDISTLEKHNGFPIVVYYLDYTSSPAERKRIRRQMLQVSTNGGNLQDIRYYTNAIGLTCVRAPTKKFLDNHRAPICHLLLIGPKHVCYIPCIQDFMKTVFQLKDHTKQSEQRCFLCFALLPNEDVLLSHLKSASCYYKTRQPPAIVLPEPGKYIAWDDPTCLESPELTVILDSESRLIPKTPATAATTKLAVVAPVPIRQSWTLD